MCQGLEADLVKARCGIRPKKKGRKKSYVLSHQIPKKKKKKILYIIRDLKKK